jgi:hypothetical protein
VKRLATIAGIDKVADVDVSLHTISALAAQQL